MLCIIITRIRIIFNYNLHQHHEGKSLQLFIPVDRDSGIFKILFLYVRSECGLSFPNVNVYFLFAFDLDVYEYTCAYLVSPMSTMS